MLPDLSNIAPDSIAKQDKQKFMLHNVQEGLSIFFIKRVDIQKCINGPRRTYSMTRFGIKKKSFKLNVWPPKCIATEDK